MIIRNIVENDLEQLKEIHQKYYSHEFPFEDFIGRFFESMVVEDKGEIISACTLRTLIEAVMITDKNVETGLRREALLRILATSLLVAGRTGHCSVQAFIQDDTWEKQLKRYGFRECKGKALFIG
jgi:glutathione peroxidase-family protein